MAKIAYWDTIAVPFELNREEYQEVFHFLTQASYKELNLEEIGNTEPVIFSCRKRGMNSLRTRLLFASTVIDGKRFFVLLEELPDHQYHRSKYIDNAVAINDFLNKHHTGIKENESWIQFQVNVEAKEHTIAEIGALFPDEDANETAEHNEYSWLTQIVSSRGKWIYLTDAQNKVIAAKPPFMAIGAAGSGKSSALEKTLENMVVKLAEEHQDELENYHQFMQEQNNEEESQQPCCDDASDVIEITPPLRKIIAVVVPTQHLKDTYLSQWKNSPLSTELSEHCKVKFFTNEEHTAFLLKVNRTEGVIEYDTDDDNVVGETVEESKEEIVTAQSSQENNEVIDSASFLHFTKWWQTYSKRSLDVFSQNECEILRLPIFVYRQLHSVGVRRENFIGVSQLECPLEIAGKEFLIKAYIAYKNYCETEGHLNYAMFPLETVARFACTIVDEAHCFTPAEIQKICDATESDSDNMFSANIQRAGKNSGTQVIFFYDKDQHTGNFTPTMDYIRETFKLTDHDIINLGGQTHRAPQAHIEAIRFIKELIVGCLPQGRSYAHSMALETTSELQGQIHLFTTTTPDPLILSNINTQAENSDLTVIGYDADVARLQNIDDNPLIMTPDHCIGSQNQNILLVNPLGLLNPRLLRELNVLIGELYANKQDPGNCSKKARADLTPLEIWHRTRLREILSKILILMTRATDTLYIFELSERNGTHKFLEMLKSRLPIEQHVTEISHMSDEEKAQAWKMKAQKFNEDGLELLANQAYKKYLEIEQRLAERYALSFTKIEEIPEEIIQVQTPPSSVIVVDETISLPESETLNVERMELANSVITLSRSAKPLSIKYLNMEYQKIFLPLVVDVKNLLLPVIYKNTDCCVYDLLLASDFGFLHIRKKIKNDPVWCDQFFTMLFEKNNNKISLFHQSLALKNGHKVIYDCIEHDISEKKKNPTKPFRFIDKIHPKVFDFERAVDDKCILRIAKTVWSGMTNFHSDVPYLCANNRDEENVIKKLNINTSNIFPVANFPVGNEIIRLLCTYSEQHRNALKDRLIIDVSYDELLRVQNAYYFKLFATDGIVWATATFVLSQTLNVDFLRAAVAGIGIMLIFGTVMRMLYAANEHYAFPSECLRRVKFETIEFDAIETDDIIRDEVVEEIEEVASNLRLK